MNRRNFIKTTLGALAAVCVPVRAEEQNVLLDTPGQIKPRASNTVKWIVPDQPFVMGVDKGAQDTSSISLYSYGEVRMLSSKRVRRTVYGTTPEYRKRIAESELLKALKYDTAFKLN